MSEPRLYTDLAHLWPRLSPPGDYLEDAAIVTQVLRAHLSDDAPDRPRVLELGAGGGHALHHLCRDFDMTALDRSEAMLAQCRALNPRVPTVTADMRDFALPDAQPFDAVLIHDAVDYLVNEAQVRSTLGCAAAHLKPGGVLVIAPTYVRETFEDMACVTDQSEDGRLSYLSCVHDADESDDVFELILVYLIRHAGQAHKRSRVDVVEDRHVCGLFASERWLGWMREAGFAAEAAQCGQEDRPHVMFVGKRAARGDDPGPRP